MKTTWVHREFGGIVDTDRGGTYYIHDGSLYPASGSSAKDWFDGFTKERIVLTVSTAAEHAQREADIDVVYSRAVRYLDDHRDDAELISSLKRLRGDK